MPKRIISLILTLTLLSAPLTLPQMASAATAYGDFIVPVDDIPEIGEDGFIAPTEEPLPETEEDLSGYESRQGENGKYAFFSSEGEQLTDYVYGKVYENFAKKRTWTFEDTFIASHGDMKTETWGYTSHASREYAVVSKDGKMQYIGTDFNEINRYDRDNPFYTDLAKNIEHGYSWMSVGLSGGHPYDETKHIGVYDTANNKAVWYVGDYGANNVSPLFDSHFVIYTPDNKQGLIDLDGRLILEPVYDKIAYAASNFGGAIYGTVDLYRNGVYEGKMMLTGYESRWQKNVYNTAIKVKINNAEIPCYVIDDYAVIAAEDLGGYGYDVVWDDEKQRLSITRNPEYYEINPKTELKGEISTVYTSTEYSDIQVLFNNHAIQAYSINGRMLIRPESAMVGDDVKCEFDWNTYTLNITVDGLEMK